MTGTVRNDYLRRWSASGWRLLILALFLAPNVARAEGSGDYIVTFRAGTSTAVRGVAVRDAGAALRFDYGSVDAAAVRVPNTKVLAALQRHASVLAIVPDRPVSAYPVASGKGGGKKPGGGASTQVVPAGVARVGVPTTTSNGQGIGVAVLDTGIDLRHSDLAGTVNAFSAYGGSCQDDAGHGTHVAGIIAAQDNATDVIGVAPRAQLYCLKVLDSKGAGSDATVMAGLDWVLRYHHVVAPAIRVVNLSLSRPGSVGDNPSFHDLIIRLEQAGVAVVVAAGNDPSLETSQQIPAAYPESIAVASTTAVAGLNYCPSLGSPIGADTASYFTTDGPGVTISAPGEEAETVAWTCLISSVGIQSTRLGGGTTRMSGTSMAAPHVSGIVARHFQRDQAYVVSDIRQFLVLDADRAGVVPLPSPTTSYSFDGVLEGIARAR